MSKTFKSIAPGSNATIVVAATDGNVTVYVHQNIGAIDLSASVAPALALAILEAAGFEADIDDASSLVNNAMGRLAMHVATEAAKAKEAADREALEGEALVLANTYRRAAGINLRSTFAQIQDQNAWTELALKARELHGGTK